MYFCYFVIISTLKRAGSFIWTNLNPLHPRMLCAKFGWNWPCGSWREDFKFHTCIFVFLNYLPLERAWLFIWSNLNSIHQRILCAKFGWNWSSGYGEEDQNVKSLRQQRRTTDKFWSEKVHLSLRLRSAKMMLMYFSLFRYFLPFPIIFYIFYFSSWKKGNSP